MDYEILINKDNLIQVDQLPKKLTAVGKNIHPTVSLDENETDDIMLEERAAYYFNQMVNDFNRTHKVQIVPESGYRSIERQRRLLKFYFEKEGEKAFDFVALPQTSEHHTGLAIDISLIANGKYQSKITGEEPEIQELMEICHQYGFILRYPKGKEDITGYTYEPWHYRFVGLELAKRIKESGLTLEEMKESEKVKNR